jgi:probable rRNA maturation factor
MIQYIAEGVVIPTLEKSRINRWIKETATVYDRKTGDIAFIFCSDERILEINNKYLNHNYFTDIITFDYSENSIISGDIFISVDTVKSNSEELNVSFDLELKRILIHGILHLCGQDDKTPESKAEMTMKENLALELYNE